MAAALLAVGTRRMDWEDPRGRDVRDVALDSVADGIAGGWRRGGGVVVEEGNVGRCGDETSPPLEGAGVCRGSEPSEYVAVNMSLCVRSLGSNRVGGKRYTREAIDVEFRNPLYSAKMTEGRRTK